MAGLVKGGNVALDYIVDNTNTGLEFLKGIKPSQIEMDKRMLDASIEAEKRLGIPHPNTPQQRIDAMNIDSNLFHGTRDKDGFLSDEIFNTNDKLVDTQIYLSPQENFSSVFTNDIKGINPGGGVNEWLTKEPGWNKYSKRLPVQSAKPSKGMILPLAGKVDNVDFDYTTLKGQQTIDEFLAAFPDDTLSKRDVKKLQQGDFSMVEDNAFQDFIKAPNKKNAEFYVSEVPYNDLKGERQYNELIGLTKPGKAYPEAVDKNVRLNFGNVRARDAAFNPKYLGVGPGSILATDLFAGENPNMDNSIRKNLAKTLNDRKIETNIEQYGELKAPERNNFIGELADGMKRFTSLERDPTGASNMFFGGGAKALDDLSYGMTPMQQMPGRIPAMPTNEAMMNFLELVGL